MFKSRPLKLVFSVLFICLATSTAYLYLENASLRDQLSRGAGGGAIADSAEKAKAADESVAVATAKPKDGASLAVEGTVEAENAGAGNERRERRLEQLARFVANFDDPDERMAMIERGLREVDRRYSKFFQTLDLEPDQIEALRIMLAEQGVLRFEERAKSRFFESEEDLAAMQADIDGRSDELMESMSDILGEEGVEALQAYNQEQPYRGRVDRLETSLSYTKSPMSAEQSASLVAAYATIGSEFQYTKDLSDGQSLRSQEIAREDVDTYVSEMETFDSLVLAEASKVLNEVQLANLAEQQLADRTELERRLEFRVDGGGGGRGFGGGPGRGGPRGQ